MGLRETKKEQTRHLIADTAWRMFADRGFDRVTVTEIARVAKVAPATVFNYFPTKEDIFYRGLDVYGERLIESVAARPVKESALSAVRRFVLNADGLVSRSRTGDPPVLEQLRTLNRVIAGSPSLQAREQRAIARYTASLAELLATEAGLPSADIQATVAAHALVGVQRTLIDYVRRRVLDDRVEGLADDLHRLGTDAFAILENGLRNYATKASPNNRISESSPP